MQPFFAACYAQSFGVALTTTTRRTILPRNRDTPEEAPSTSPSSNMPQILAWLLYTSFSTGERRLDKLTEMITEANPMGFPMTVNTKHYEAKVKRLLMDFALARQSVFHA